MKMYPSRRPVVGEIVNPINGHPTVLARITRVRRAARRWFYNVDVRIVRGITTDQAGNSLYGMETGARFQSISTCWDFPEKPNL